MGKKWIIVIAVIILFTLGVAFGVYAYEKGKTKDSNMLKDKQLASSENIEESNSIDGDTISTSTSETRISPNCTIVEKQYFKGCDHLIKDIKDVPEEWINQTEEDIKEHYSDWTLQSFTNNQIIVAQEKEGYCGQHYIIKEHNGVLGIYTLDQNGTETWKEDTEISTMYLPEEDLEKIEEGIQVIGDDRLHTTLEDFE